MGGGHVAVLMVILVRGSRIEALKVREGPWRAKAPASPEGFIGFLIDRSIEALIGFTFSSYDRGLV